MIETLGLCAALIALPKTTNTPPYGFRVWVGPIAGINAGIFTNTLQAGFATNFSGSNYQATFSATQIPTNSVFAITATNRGNLESEWSRPWITNQFVGAKIDWTWVYPIIPQTNIITVSAGTNSISWTNPAATRQFWRLTNATLSASDSLKGPWVAITNWAFPSNGVVPLKITKQ